MKFHPTIDTALSVAWLTIWALILFTLVGLTVETGDHGAIPMLMTSWAMLGGILALIVAIRRRWIEVLALVLIGIGLFFSPISSWGLSAHLWWTFEARESRYQKIIDRADTSLTYGRLDGVTFRIERGPPTRIIFPYGKRSRFGWQAIVHDESDELGHAQFGYSPGTNPRGHQIGRLAESELQGCGHIKEHWYRCWFK